MAVPDSPVPDSLPATRDALHRLAEHVLAPARYAATGHIGLVPAPGGFATPPYGPTPFGAEPTVLAMDLDELVGISGVAHQNGTVRFGTDPASSALDLHCRTHEVDNLHVADSSFFVSSSVADHLSDRLGIRASAQAARIWRIQGLQG